MNAAKYVLLSFLLVLSTATCRAQKPLDSLLITLKQSDFFKIYDIKDSIINYQKVAIPKLIEMLDDTRFVKLTNTADLIYPGATVFYGHGGIVNYDLDYINVRAAWVLEQIVFYDFGYSKLAINEDELLKLHQREYSKYLKDGSHVVNFIDKTSRERLIGYRQLLSAKVKKWWAKNGKSWTRFKALKDALESANVKAQVKALEYLRGRIQSKKSTRCDNLTTESFYHELYPLIERIGKTNTKAKREADFFLIYNKNARF